VNFDRSKLRAQLRRNEGVRLAVYRCSAGKLTIGVGRNLDDCGISAAETRQLGISVASCIAHGITNAQSDALLDNDIDQVVTGLDRALPWWRSLSDVRQRVIIDMGFNMGVQKLLGFRNTLAAVRAGRWSDAVFGMAASAWHGQVGGRALRLEAMMLTDRDP
jgi:lysozyme